jgi:anti-sigma factor ChrR (cupin superfamily)
LPHLEEAFRSSRDYDERLGVARVIGHLRSIDAPLLRQLLEDNDPEIWKTALDGLVMLADQITARARVHEILDAARKIANAEKRSWIDEAVGQMPPAWLATHT